MPCQPLRAPAQVAALTGEREGLIDQVASSQERLADLEARDAELGWVIVLSYWRMGHGCVWVWRSHARQVWGCLRALGGSQHPGDANTGWPATINSIPPFHTG